MARLRRRRTGDGRRLREKKRGPIIAFVADFIEAAHQTLRGHQNERVSIIKSTPGCAGRFVADFDYSCFRRAA